MSTTKRSGWPAVLHEPNESSSLHRKRMINKNQRRSSPARAAKRWRVHETNRNKWNREKNEWFLALINCFRWIICNKTTNTTTILLFFASLSLSAVVLMFAMVLGIEYDFRSNFINSMRVQRGKHRFFLYVFLVVVVVCWTTATPFGENCFLTVYNWNVTAACGRGRPGQCNRHTRRTANSGKRNSGDLDVKLAKMKINCAQCASCFTSSQNETQTKPKKGGSHRVIQPYRLQFLIFGCVVCTSVVHLRPFMVSVSTEYWVWQALWLLCI